MLYHVRYEDGDEEDLYHKEIDPLVIFPAAKRLARPRMPSDPDADLKIDEYNRRLAEYEVQQEDRAFHKVNPSGPAAVSAAFDFPVASATQLAGAKACARQIAENAAAGHCPMADVAKLYIFFSSEVNLNKRGILRVFAEQRGPYTESADFKLFSDLTGGEYDLDDNLLMQFARGAKNPAAAVAPMISQAVQDGLVRSADKARLQTKYASWLAGIPWRKCVMSASNRPSLGSWNGWPWDSFNIMDRDCGLKHAVKWKTIEIQAERQPPSALVPPDYVPSFQLIWSAEDGIADVDAACEASFATVCKRVAKRKAEERSNGNKKKRIAKGKSSGGAKKRGRR